LEGLPVSKNRKNSALRQGAVLFVTLALLASVGPASGAGLLEMLFGGGRRAPPPPPSPTPFFQGLADAFGSPESGERRPDRGPSMAYCVRLCDGQPFPVQTVGGSPAQVCSSSCPAAQTKVFSGSGVEYAVASDGKRYADLPNAFAYRKKSVAGCTCNGRTVGGLVPLDVKTDQTLRAGDLVATNNGVVAFKGMKNQTAEFTPVQGKLSQIQISPAAAQARAEAPPPVPATSGPKPSGRSAQFAR
jgi:hypothetical protein